jgi:2-phospho-L-lactate guanylyltransferase
MGSPAPVSSAVAGWSVVVPVKLLTLAKSRLSAYGDEARAALALAFAADVVAAALRCAAVRDVLVVTDDVRAAEALAGPRARVVADTPGGGLNAALAHGAALLRAETPAVGVVALTSDLPTLRPADLSAALAAARGRAFVADADGVGTTLLAAAPGHDLLPAYGPASRLRHLATGALELTAPETLRRDVDTPADLQAALRLGVGPETGRVLSRLDAVAECG